MNFKGQHIGGIFTFLAGLIILAHAVVPHHHHFELIHSSGQESTCEIPAQEKNTEAQDSHCHAFNIIVSDKTNTTFLKQSISDIVGIIVQIEIPPIKNITATFFGNHALFIKQFFFTARSLRGPPVNA